MIIKKIAIIIGWIYFISYISISIFTEEESILNSLLFFIGSLCNTLALGLNNWDMPTLYTDKSKVHMYLLCDIISIHKFFFSIGDIFITCGFIYIIFNMYS